MAKLQVVLQGLVLTGVALALSACGTMGPYNGYVSAPPEARAAIERGEWVEEVVAQIAIVQNPDFNGGKISPKALRKIQEYSMACQAQIDAQLAGAGQAGVGGAVSYGAAGTGTGPAAKAAKFTGPVISATNHAKYGGIAYILPGAANGLATGSYAMASGKGTCTRDFWEDIAKTDPDFKGTHVVVAYAGKTRDSTPPALGTHVRPVSSDR